MVDYSLNESASRSRLAAKGAGFPWGLADEVYRAVFWLLRRNLPAPAMLIHLLEHYPNPDMLHKVMPDVRENEYDSGGAWLCPIMLGCALSDRIDATHSEMARSESANAESANAESTNSCATINFRELKCPLLMLPFIAQMATDLDRVLTVELDSLEMVTDGEHVHFSSVQVPLMEHVGRGKISFANVSTFTFDANEKQPLYNRAQIDSAIWKALDEFAHRTYAPASEASRISGAGAGVLDND